MDAVQIKLESQLEEPDGGKGLFTLPCGYLDETGLLHRDILIRALSGQEEDILASRKVPANRKMDMVLAGCIERIGNIQDRRKIGEIVADLLISDRTFLFFALRSVTHGDLFPFRKECPNESCKQKSIHQFDLRALKIYPMQDPMKRVYEIELPRSKVKVLFRPMAGKDEQRRDQYKARLGLFTLMLMLRVQEINGKPVDSNDIARLPASDRDFLRAAIEDVEGGVDTTLELECQYCGHVYEAELDPSDPAFFFPSETQLRWKRRSSS